jgi:phthiocerol/phenolphthiocerol synthesis type-I polyketide synthase E
MTSSSGATASQSESLPDNAIAVIGMAGRFPGADTVSAFWDNLRRGEESIVTLSEADLVASGVSEKSLANPAYVRRAALVDGIDEFDAEVFGFTPQAARTMDPQHRLFLQCAWHALEDSGYEPGSLDGSVGVYATSTTSGYLLHNLISHHDPNAIIGEGVTFDMVNLSLQNDKDYLATRVAHQFNLRGPALSVQTACSSALVAVHLACQSILNGESEMALAGGASLRIPHHVGYFHAAGSMVSATGHCRPFDVRADGTVFASGAGVVVLKSLEAAMEDGDRIHAVIRGSALNNDGSAKMTYAAPSASSQADVIAEAHAVADVDASTVSYVETHGTATPLGDPIEIEGLRQAFELAEADRPGPCYLGSVKSNIGHLESAAGIASLIKVILCLKHRAIPATLHYTSPNPELHLEQGPFVVRSEYGPWVWDGVRRAGVSSFGVGGTNAHVVLEEAPPIPASVAATGPQVLLLSARSTEGLRHARASLAAALSSPDAPALPDVAYTLQRRRHEGVRMAAVATGVGDAATLLTADEHDNVVSGTAVPDTGDADRVVLLFSGQGAQHIGMARGLYQSEPVFAEHFDECAAGFNAELGIDLRAEIFDGTARNLERTDRTQPALFAVEYALAKLFSSFGVTPAAMAGHSIGEYAAATIAGVFDLATATKAVSMRARLMHSAPRGVMVAVALAPEAVAEYLSADVDLATVNDPGGCVVAGTEESIRAFQGRLAEAGITARRVRTSHAFHSRLMDPVLPEFTGFMSRLTLHEPRIPLLSNLSGTWLAPGEATNPTTWARQIRQTVRFSDELGALLAHPGRVFVEVGPGGTLTASAMRHPKWSEGHRAVRLMRHHAQNRDDRDTFLQAMGQLWTAGVDVDWTPLRGDHRPQLTSLPGYPFERQRHWVDPLPRSGRAGDHPAINGAEIPSSGAATETTRGTVNGSSPIETTLQRVFSQCLGVASVDRNANFFEVGGDSLVAISVAMAASHDGLDLTPQDIYENPTVTSLSKALIARYAAGGLARRSWSDTVCPPVPPNVDSFLERGVRERGQWRMPVILRLRPDVGLEDVTAVLTAVINHHEALRLRIVAHGGGWEQHIGETLEAAQPATRSLPGDITPGSPEERATVLDICREQIREQDLSHPALAATYVTGAADGPSYLAISVHGIAGDDASRDILLTDIFTGFGQRLARNEIELQPVATQWGEWSARCAALSTHPAVVDSRDFWLETATAADVSVAGSEVTEPPAVADLKRLSSSLTVGDTSEIDDARRRLGLSVDDILLAALSQTIAATIGEGTVAIDLAGPGRSVLRPDVDLRRTVGWFSTVYPVALECAKPDDNPARQLLDDVHETLNAVPHYGIGYGLLRYLYAPTARALGATRRAEVFFSNVGTIPDLSFLASDDAPVQVDSDIESQVREAIPGLGHAVEVRVYRSGGRLHVDWWYDVRRVDSATASALADGFGDAVLNLVQRANAEDELDSVREDLALVELS